MLTKISLKLCYTVIKFQSDLMINEIEKHIGSYVVIKTANSRRTISGILNKNDNKFYIKLGVKLLPVNVAEVTEIFSLRS